MSSLRLCKRRLNQICARSEAVSDADDIEFVDTLLSDLNNQFDVYLNIHHNDVSDETDESVLVEFDTYDERVRKCRATLSRHKRLSQEAPASIQTISATPIPSSNQQSPGCRHVNVHTRLPKLSVPHFSGDRDQWVSFRDAFVSSIHDNPNLSEVDKLQYLRSFLHGEAASLILPLAITAANYATAWTTILESYNRPLFVIESLLTRLIDCKPVSTNRSNLRTTYSTFRETLELLDRQGEYASSRDPILLLLLQRKLDESTDLAWAEHVSSIETPTIETFLAFLKNQCNIYDHHHRKDIRPLRQSNNSIKQSNNSRMANRPSIRINALNFKKCIVCQEVHSIYRCNAFKQLSVQGREEVVSDQKLCVNCLSPGHIVANCSSTKTCLTCNNRHHTLLHRNSPHASGPNSSSEIPTSRVTAQNEPRRTSPPTPAISSNSNMVNIPSILPTAIINIQASTGRAVPARILLDTGSQASFISESFLNKIGLPRIQSRVPVSCVVDQKLIYSKGKVELQFWSHLSTEKSFNLTAHVLSKFLGNLPQQPLSVSNLPEISSRFSLADPEFYLPSEIHLILGASFLFEILKPTRFYSVTDQLYLQDSDLGCLVCSKSNTCAELNSNFLQVDNSSIDDRLLQRLWDLETVPECPPPLSPSDRACESYFVKTTSQSSEGRFCVRLPLRENAPRLGNSCHTALRRFLQLERRFAQNSELHKDYAEFMAEYEALGHMERTAFTQANLPPTHYIIPHHGVMQQKPTGMKLRVVFDASAKTSNHLSLNEILHVGPRLQTDITRILQRFRKHRYVLTTDIEKMYRQIQLHPDDQNYQLIFWRSNPDSDLHLYRLSTVTYGLSCSPFLALRTIEELVARHGCNFPQASEVLLNGRYIDDLFFGHDDLSQLRSIRDEVVALLQLGCLPLKKWSSNHPDLLSDLDTTDLANPHIFSSPEDYSLKALGIVWMPMSDSFSYNIAVNNLSSWTKRALLADAARIYDPLGWIAPVSLKFKALFQETWVRHLGWDDSLPADLLREWKALRDTLPHLGSIHIPRHIGSGRAELHGFSDASKMAYGAVVYLKTVSGDGQIQMQLVIAKTKLAPIKPVSIPRLELCGAHLLAKLISHIRPDFPDVSSIILWSDSTTVLAWLKSLPRQWNTFVANRVGYIVCPSVPWYYVKSKHNPADLASRGVDASSLVQNALWWHGPDFLHHPSFTAPTEKFSTMEESKPLISNVVAVSESFWSDFFNHFSRLTSLVRSAAYLFRVKNRLRKLANPSSLLITTSEYQSTFYELVNYVQHQYFPEDISHLIAGRSVPRSSGSRTLSPFLDANGILRVGGRLQNVPSKLLHPHPILLPRCHFSDLIIRKIHTETFHGGFNLVCSRVRQDFWIFNLQKSVKRLIHSCVRCVRYRAQTYSPEMGPLPAVRLTPNKPFDTTGVDFAGPLVVRPTKTRGNTSVNCFIAVFICCATKAIHLELVMGLSVQCLILCLRRFIARRGKCTTILSDNGRNFVGCHNLLRQFRNQITSFTKSPELYQFLAESLITWKFIPPYSPHFGGIWESGVKSVKGHLYRQFNGTTLSLEEFQTALCEIESVLNSRPLTPLSFTEPLMPLTPAHLLTGYPVSQFPEMENTLAGSGDSSRLATIKQVVHGFWKRWRSEYLHLLMKKPKWQSTSANPQLDDIVLIKRSSDPPRLWPLARITNLLPGKDGVVRVVEVITKRGVRQEAVRNLIPIKVAAPDGNLGGSLLKVAV